MSESDRDLIALFDDEPTPPRDEAFVARVAADVARAGRVRLWAMSGAGLVLGLSGAAIVGLLSPILVQAGGALSEALRTPGASWIAMAAGLAIAVGVPLWRAR